MAAIVSLTEALPADLHGLRALVADYYAFDRIACDEQQVRRGLVTLLDNPALGRAWFIKREGAVVGYAVLAFGYDHELGGRVGTLTDFHLRAEYRGRGIGAAALRLVEHEAKAAGLSALELQAARDNLAAQRFYRSSGYATFDRIPMVKRF